MSQFFQTKVAAADSTAEKVEGTATSAESMKISKTLTIVIILLVLCMLINLTSVIWTLLVVYKPTTADTTESGTISSASASSYHADVFIATTTDPTEQLEERLAELERVNSELLLQIESQKSLSESIQNLSAEINSYSANDGTFYINGEASAAADDSPSDVSCPAGYYAAECYCDDDSRCDGTRLYADDIQKCTAHRKFGRNGTIRAVVKCKLERGKEVQVLSKDVYTGETLQCPSGFTMDFGTKSDEWSEDRVTYYLRTVIDNAITFGWESSHAEGSIFLSAVCTRNI